MQTNGTRLDERMLGVLLRLGVRVGLSVDGNRLGGRPAPPLPERAQFPSGGRGGDRAAAVRALPGGLRRAAVHHLA